MKAIVICTLAFGAVMENSALTRVVKKLEGMLEQSKKDGEDDRTEFAKVKCQCTTDLENANAAIQQSTEIIARESGEVEKFRGANGKLSQEIQALTQNLAANKDQQDQSTAERDQEKQDFEDKKADMEGAIGQLGEAITMLAAIGADQTAESRDTADRDRFVKLKGSLVSVKKHLRESMRAVSDLLPADKRAKITSFLEAPFSGTYTSQSGEIIGILKNMKDTFNEDLRKATELESKRQKAYDNLMKLLQEDAANMEKTRTSKRDELAVNSTEIKNKKETIAENEQIKADNEEIVRDTTEACDEKTRKYDGRRATRASEEAAIAKAVTILSSDTAFGNKALQPGDASTASITFMQIRRHMAADPFESVLVEMDKMIAAIEKEEEADTEKKQWCEDENASNKKKLSDSKNAQDQENAKIATSKEDLGTAHENLQNAQDAIKKLSDHRRLALETRKAGNLAYQATIAELHEAHDILAQAVKVLRDFYEAEETASSQAEHEFNTQGGNDVISLLQDIQKNTQGQETSAHADEEEDQGFFEIDMTDTDKSLADERKNVATEEGNVAEAQERLLIAETELKHQTEVEKQIEAYKASIKPGCDFILDNFASRQKNRQQEKDQLTFASGKVKERQTAHAR
eukprot:GEMP01027008.1.p1 GENE.GEMP01027008.1~~GEMP01027008.1.p1  ORF type:complete len:633 (+),score=181.55 GEMP01027008.1:101-1999(+)